MTLADLFAYLQSEGWTREHHNRHAGLFIYCRGEDFVQLHEMGRDSVRVIWGCEP